MTESLPKGYKPWLILSLVVLVGSLVLLGVAVVAAFGIFAEVAPPLWVVVLGAIAALGVAAGFGGLFLLLATAGWLSWRESRRVAILPPEHAEKN